MDSGGKKYFRELTLPSLTEKSMYAIRRKSGSSGILKKTDGGNY